MVILHILRTKKCKSSPELQNIRLANPLRIIELLKQLFWKQNKYALNNHNYGKKKYGRTERLVASNSHENPGPIATPQPDPAPNDGFQVRGASDTAQNISMCLDNGIFWVIMPDSSEDSWPNGGIRRKTILEVTDEISKIVGRDDIEKQWEFIAICRATGIH